jgi:hypothetical protein
VIVPRTTLLHIPIPGGETEKSSKKGIDVSRHERRATGRRPLGYYLRDTLQRGIDVMDETILDKPIRHTAEEEDSDR